jgi:hypothetical protein
LIEKVNVGTGQTIKINEKWDLPDRKSNDK